MQVGDKVGWNWGTSHAEGVVQEVVAGRMEKEIKGKTIRCVSLAGYVPKAECQVAPTLHACQACTT